MARVRRDAERVAKLLGEWVQPPVAEADIAGAGDKALREVLGADAPAPYVAALKRAAEPTLRQHVKVREGRSQLVRLPPIHP